jgi:hypothetical protein
VIRPPRIAALLAAAASVAGCNRIADRVVPIVTKTHVSWAWIDERGGMAVKTSTATSNTLSLAFRSTHTSTMVDSAVAVCAITRRQEARQIVVGVDSCVVGDIEYPGFNLTMPKPAAGTYDVVYDDAAAGFPSLGRVTVP